MRHLCDLMFARQAEHSETSTMSQFSSANNGNIKISPSEKQFSILISFYTLNHFLTKTLGHELLHFSRCLSKVKVRKKPRKPDYHKSRSRQVMTESLTARFNRLATSRFKFSPTCREVLFRELIDWWLVLVIQMSVETLAAINSRECEPTMRCHNDNGGLKS